MACLRENPPQLFSTMRTKKSLSRAFFFCFNPKETLNVEKEIHFQVEIELAIAN